jgi:hypothetical protein
MRYWLKAAEFYLHVYRPADTTDAFQIRYKVTGPTRYLHVHARAYAYTGYISHGRSAYRITVGPLRFGSYQIEVRLISK